ncbi:MAG: sensor histidine kinase [Gemmatimonadaceae bacterium]
MMEQSSPAAAAPAAVAPLSAPDERALRERSARLTGRVLLALVVLLAVMEAIQVLLRRPQMTGKPVSLGSALYMTTPSWVLLALLVPPVLYLAARFPLSRDAGRATAVHGLASLLFPVFHLGAMGLFYHVMAEPGYDMGLLEQTSRFLLWYFGVDFTTYWLIVGAYFAVHYYRAYQAREIAASQLQASLTDARLRVLRAQLNPHFLFNTLNAISSLALQGRQDDVVQTLGRLSELLRTSLDETLPQEIPLARELAFLDGYLEIQQIRHGDRLTVRTEVDADTLDALVPSMLMQPLVENALRHGVGARPGPGEVVVRAVRAGDRLCLEVHDSGPGFAPGSGGDAEPPAVNPGEARRRIGLSNTRDRLEQLYGYAHTFACGASPWGGASVRVEIPYRLEQAEVWKGETEGAVRAPDGTHPLGRPDQLTPGGIA